MRCVELDGGTPPVRNDGCSGKDSAAESYEMQMDELDFFLDLLDMGITLEDIKECCPDKYEYSKIFMEEHGLV